MTAQLPLPFDKRWDRRRETWPHPDVTFNPRGYAVDVVDEAAARAFVLNHHYSASFPAARLSIGLFDGRSLAGVAVFSVPMQQAVVPRYSGLSAGEGVELGRFVLSESVAFNGETWFLARAFRLLQREKGARVVVSYSDPMERSTDAGILTKPAHFGTIYQAHNAVFAGRAAARWLWLDRHGQVVSERALSKIRNAEVGHAYAARRLEAAGADPRGRHEDPRTWLDRVLRAPVFRRIRHPGNFAYAFGLDRSAKAAIAATVDAQPYPHGNARHQRKALSAK